MTEVLDFKCPNCGGSIKFDSTEGEMKCPFCDSVFDVEALRDYEEILNSQTEDETEWDDSGFDEWTEDGLTVYTCNNCGGEIVTDSTTSATSCPFCDSPVVLSGRLSGQFKPDYVIPFKLDKAAAEQGFLNHLKGKTLLPKIFKTEAKIKEIKGVYVPFWLFDTGVDADIRYHATRVRFWSTNDYNYTETRHYSVLRRGTLDFKHVPVDGSEKLPDDLTESLEPYDFSEAVDFKTAYLAGFFADKYDVDSSAAKPRANDRIKQSTEWIFRDTVNGYATVYPEHTSVKFFKGKVKYALYPVWLMTTVWKDRTYTFAMNGQTGKFVGNLPLDRGAFWKWFAIIASVSAACAFGILFFVGRRYGLI